MNHERIVLLLLAGALAAACVLVGVVGVGPSSKPQVAIDAPTDDPNHGSSSASPAHTQKLGSDAANDGAAQKLDEQPLSPGGDSAAPFRWPAAVENLILEYLSQLERFDFTTITSVRCDTSDCEIVFSGLEPNPTIVDEYHEVLGGLYLPPINAMQGSIGTREIAAGNREFVIRISNVPWDRQRNE